MKCPTCDTEQRFFIEYDDDSYVKREGYRCPNCGATRDVPVVDLSELEKWEQYQNKITDKLLRKQTLLNK